MSGTVVDATSGAPVAGAVVKVRLAQQVLAEAVSGTGGQFRVAFETGGSQARNLRLDAEHSDFIPPESRLFVVASGRSDQAVFDFELLPRALSHCIQGAGRQAIIVGQFSGEGDDLKRLSSRMGEALTYSLRVQLQRLKVRPELQPTFAACWEIEPRSIDLAGRCARALRAEALVFGKVSRTANRFNVKTFVGDDYGLYAGEAGILNKGVDLVETDEAVLDLQIHAAILTVLAAAYQRQQRYGECVEATVAAERLGRQLTEKLQRLRRACIDSSGVSALTRGGHP